MPHNEYFLLFDVVLVKVVDGSFIHHLLLGQLHLLHVVKVDYLIIEANYLVLELVVGSLELQTHLRNLVVLTLQHALHPYLLNFRNLPRTRVVLGY